MKVDLKKGDYRYEALQVVYSFMKEFGEPEDKEEYWHEAVKWAQANYNDDLSMKLLLAVLNHLEERKQGL